MIFPRLMKPTALALAICTALTGCTAFNKSASESSSGGACLVGGAAGALLVSAVAVMMGEKVNPVVVVAGALAGCGAGLAYRARVKQLEDLARAENIKMQVREIEVLAVPEKGDGPVRVVPVGMSASFESGNMFDTGKPELNAEGQRKVRLMAKIVADRQNQDRQEGKTPKKILVVGHTDATGSAETNQVISQARAKNVAKILAEEGISSSDIYFQGAGASKPVADNSTSQGREANRRVELTEVGSEEVLAQLIKEDSNNPKYLAHGTRAKVEVKTTSKANVKAAQQASSVVVRAPVIQAPDTPTAGNQAPARAPAAQETRIVESMPANQSLKIAGSGKYDFGGVPVRSTTSTLAKSIKPMGTKFSLIETANADQPVSSCLGDMPRESGAVMNLASGRSISDFNTTDFLPNLNGRGWYSPVNGHVVSVGPIAILRDHAKVAENPKMQFIPNYAKGGKETPLYKAVANTYDGADSVLYRVFSTDKNSAATCMDIVFDKRSGQVVDGEIFYPKNNDAFVAKYLPSRH